MFGEILPQGLAFGQLLSSLTGYSFVFSTRNYLLRDGRTTFALPDLRGRANTLLAQDQGYLHII
jgi:microcystin-dependent protein